jgi:hypothetical protein
MNTGSNMASLAVFRRNEEVLFKSKKAEPFLILPRSLTIE